MCTPDNLEQPLCLIRGECYYSVIQILLGSAILIPSISPQSHFSDRIFSKYIHSATHNLLSFSFWSHVTYSKSQEFCSSSDLCQQTQLTAAAVLYYFFIYSNHLRITRAHEISGIKQDGIWWPFATQADTHLGRSVNVSHEELDELGSEAVVVGSTHCLDGQLYGLTILWVAAQEMLHCLKEQDGAVAGMHTHTHTHIRTHTHIYTHAQCTCTPTHIHAHRDVRAHTHTQVYVHTHTHAHTHRCMHAHTHTCTHTQTQKLHCTCICHLPTPVYTYAHSKSRLFSGNYCINVFNYNHPPPPHPTF